ncbi:retrovirus-related pol polyprotein from transposon TNT 1-94 [Tanacetum coccineum]|uniref:Retrovirus-related pol polyprotein from transposon TNT 1-94 n=1 Tax=Tanacetum coccineum TaxID=301880 RepID=A0ABQ5GIG9_9ASTR
MLNSNTNLQTQSSNALHNAIMEAGCKDRPPMLALVAEGSSETTTERYMENYKNVSQDIHDQLNAEAEVVHIILTGIDNDIYSTVDACPNACEMWKAIERLKQGESINVQDLETNLYWEFGKFTSRDGESLESYYSRFYKMMNELVRNQCNVTNHQVNVQFLLQLQPKWQRFVTLVKQSLELKTVSYHKLYDILKQHQNEVNEIRAERLARTANPLALVAQQQPVYHPPNHPTQNTQYSSTRTQQSTRNRGKAIVTSSAPTYDPEPATVTEDEEMSKEKEIDKLMALISLSGSNSNTNLQTQSSNALHNAIMEAGSKDRPPMLAPGNYVQWKSRIKRYIDTKPNRELIHYSLQNPPYIYQWAEKTVPVAEGSSETTIERYMENYKNVSQDIRDQMNAEAEAKAIERLKQGESINVQDLETNLYWEFGKFTSRDGESLESYYSRFYKMMNELVRNQCNVTNHQVNVQFLLQLQPEWQRFVTLVKQSQELKTVSYHKLYDILKQHQNEVNEIRAERLARTANPLALAQQQPVYHHQNHPTQNTQYSSTRSQQSTRNIGKAIVTSSAPTYNPEPDTVTKDDEMSKDKEIDKLMALISLSFKKIYKPTNNNLRTSSNSSRANQDNSPRINRGTPVVQKSGIQCYNCKEYGHVSREYHKPKRVKDAAYHKEKMLLCKQEEAGVQLNAEQADWKDDTDDEPEDQELEAHMAQIHEVTPNSVDNSRPIFDDEPIHKDDQDDTDDLDQERDLLASLVQKLKCEIDDNKNRNKSLESSNKELVDKLKGEIEDFKTKNKSLESQNNIVNGLSKDVIRSTRYLLFFCGWGKQKDMSFSTLRLPRAPKDGTEFLNKTLHVYFAKEGIRHETLTARTPKQNGVVKRRNRTLVEAARTMLSAAKVPLFFWAEVIATACFTQNRSLVIPRHEKTPYHIINARKSLVKIFHIFGSLCYIVRDGENLDKMKENGDACIFVGYSTQSRAYRMASDHISSDDVPQCLTTALEHDSLSPGPQSQENVTQTPETVTTSNELDLLFSLMFDELLNETTPVVPKSSAVHTVDAPDKH